MEKQRLGRFSPFPGPESWSQNVAPRIPNLETTCCPSPEPRLRAPPPPPPSPQSQLASAAESHLCLSPRDINTQPGTPWDWGPSRYSGNSKTAAQHALGWVSARGMARGGHLAFQIPPGLLRGLISARLCLSAPLSRLLYPKPVYTLGCTAAWRSRAGNPYSLPLRQLNWMHQDRSELLGPPAGSPVPWPLVGHF